MAALPFPREGSGFSPAHTGVLMHKIAPNTCFPVAGTLVVRGPGTGHVWTPGLRVLRRWPGDCPHVPPGPSSLWRQGWKGTQGLPSALGVLLAKPPEHVVPTVWTEVLGSLVTETVLCVGGSRVASWSPSPWGSVSHPHHPGTLLACRPRKPSCRWQRSPSPSTEGCCRRTGGGGVFSRPSARAWPCEWLLPSPPPFCLSKFSQ